MMIWQIPRSMLLPRWRVDLARYLLLRRPLRINTPRMPLVARTIESSVNRRRLQMRWRHHRIIVWIRVYVADRELLTGRLPSRVHGYLLASLRTGWNELWRKWAIWDLAGGERWL